MRPRAVIFDFNGTVSHDEPLLAEIFGEIFAERGKPLSAQEYFDRLAGFSDREIVCTWLGADHPAVDQVVRDRVERYRAAAADGSTVPQYVREAVRWTAARFPLGLVTGAARAEVEPVLVASGLARDVRALVTAEDVEHGKPHPEGYLRALELLDAGLAAPEVLVFEDTGAGIAAAKAAGMRCVGVLGTLAPERLGAADELAERLDVPLLERLLASPRS